MKCVNCGAELKEGSLYCVICGKPVQIVPDYNAFDDYLDNLVREDISAPVTVGRNKTKSDVRRNANRNEPKNSELKDNKLKDNKKVTASKKQQKKIIIISIVVIISALSILAIAITANLKKKNDNSFDYQVQKAQNAFEAGQIDEAVSYYDKALSLDSDNIDVRFSLAKIYKSKNDMDAAKILYQEIISIDADNEQAYKELIEIYDADKDYDSIIELSEENSDKDIQKLFEKYIVDEPKFTPSAGKYDEATDLVINASSDLKVYYTLDGSDPQKDGKLYSKPVPMDKEKTYSVKAVAVDSRGIASKVVSKQYQIEFKIPDEPVVDPDGGTFGAQSYITITADENCRIFYTWDTSDPDEYSQEYTEPISIPVGNNVLSVIAIDQTTGKSSDVYRTRFEFFVNK